MANKALKSILPDFLIVLIVFALFALAVMFVVAKHQT